MGLRFRKSINIGPLRINFSKSGVGFSIGWRGFRVTRSANGKKRATVSIPGTGISYVRELDREDRKKTIEKSKDKPDGEN